MNGRDIGEATPFFERLCPAMMHSDGRGTIAALPTLEFADRRCLLSIAVERRAAQGIAVSLM
jgi:hypothetical protein